MNDSVFFASFNPLFCEAPDTCELCGVNLPIFQYEYCAQNQNRERQYLKGFCCAACAAQLLQKLKRSEAREWAEEEAALCADDMDVTEFHRRRLAAFRDEEPASEHAATASAAGPARS
ncbi:MAG TPA: hypothetical protein VJQ50_07850 [Terriglobales bacterium]|jgi:hypothetical protein|nr:hypothetical protein [Terriglobales bacterium]